MASIIDGLFCILSDQKTPNKEHQMIKKTFTILKSLHFFVVTMVILALIACIGIIVPQERPINEYSLKFGNFLSHVIVSLNFNHLFSSLWFSIPLVFFCINLLSCLIHRLIKLAKKQGAFGSFIVHSGVLFLIIGGIIQYYYSETHNVILTEGTKEHIQSLDLNIMLDTFSIITSPKKDIINYVSYIEVFNNSDTPGMHGKTMVNSPFTYKNISFYQTSYGTLPNKVKNMRGSIIGHSGDTLFKGIIQFNKKVYLGKQNISFICDGFLCDFRFDMQTRSAYSISHEHRNPAFHYTLFRNDSIIASHWNLPFSKSMMNLDSDSYKIHIDSYTPAYYTGISVRTNSGSIWIWIGIACLSFGLIYVFLLPAFSVRVPDLVLENDKLYTDEGRI